MAFQKGDKVVYPNHGIGVVEDILGGSRSMALTLSKTRNPALSSTKRCPNLFTHMAAGSRSKVIRGQVYISKRGPSLIMVTKSARAAPAPAANAGIMMISMKTIRRIRNPFLAPTERSQRAARSKLPI